MPANMTGKEAVQPARHCIQVEQYRRKLELLAEGKLVEAMRIVTGGSSATAKAVEKIGGDEGALYLASISAFIVAM